MSPIALDAAFADELLELGDALCVLDSEFRVIRVNREQERITGLKREQSLGKSHWELWPDSAKPDSQLWVEYHRVQRERVSTQFETYYAPLDLWTHVTVHPTRAGGIAIFFRDVTAHRRSEQQRQLALDAAQMGWWVYDPASRVATYDRRYTDIYGVTGDRATIENFARLLHPDDLPTTMAAVEAALDPVAPRSYQAEYRVNRPDGQQRWVEAHGLATFEGAGAARRATLLVGTVRDITDRKLADLTLRQSEARTREALALLEQAIETTRKTEDRLRQGQKMEAVGNLAGGIAHDFNNLLTVILCSAESLKQALNKGEPLHEEAAEIARAGERAAAMTRQLLAFSRRQVLEPRIVDVAQLLRGLEQLLRRVVGEDLELLLLLDEGVHKLRLDPGQFEQVMLNLVINARDAMPDGGRLTIETANVVLDEAYVAEHPEAQLGPHVRIAVSDTGVGMTPEVRSRMFEPFFTTKEPGRGTGLGLSTVYGIVKQSGGSIWVYSEPGQGTTFRLYFPLAEGSEPYVPPPAAAQVNTRGKETVLLVEDDEQVRQTVHGMLRRAGYHVIAAANGGEALLICEQHTAAIHLLLTDVVMPKLNGRKLAERLHQLRPAMRVLFMSGYTENAIVHHGVLDSGLDFIAKPMSSEALLLKVRELLDR